MPLVQVNMAAGRTQDQKRALLTAITQAVHDTIDAPVETIRVWINEFPATDYMAGGKLLAERQAGPGSPTP